MEKLGWKGRPGKGDRGAQVFTLDVFFLSGRRPCATAKTCLRVMLMFCSGRRPRATAEKLFAGGVFVVLTSGCSLR